MPRQLKLARRDPATQSTGVVAGYAQTASRWPAQPLLERPHTAAELTGPRHLERRLAPMRGDLAGSGAKRALGQLIHLRARVVDEDGAPVSGALVEVWHCNAAGKYIHPNGPSPTVLVVEDDASTRELVRRTLEREGWQVREAEDGRAGLGWVVQDPPELILLDLMLPGIDGFEFVAELRRHAEWRDIPVVVITAKDLSPAERERLNGCVERILRKGTYSRDQLVDEVRAQLARRHDAA